MANFTAFQDVECVFPMSGQYGRAPRTLYYFLLLFVVVLRRQDWLTAGAAAACLTFGGSAAIHALILTPILSLGNTGVPDGCVMLPNSTMVEVAAVATDLDSDATLAIVGTGFLIVVPMALWSSQFRLSGAVPILVLWIVLMFVGMVGCMINLYAINGSASGPLKQFRFCSPGYSDPLPFGGNPATIINDSWNETIWIYFETQQASLPSCLYPCLSATELLRQVGDPRVVKFLNVAPPSALFWGLDITTAMIYGCVPLSILFCFIILVLRLRGHRSIGWDFESYEPDDRRTKTLRISVWAVNIYGLILTPFIFCVFLVWVEWVIYYNLQSELMQLVGQWAPLVGVALVFISAIVGRY